MLKTIKPAWYEISYGGGKVISLRAHKKAVAEITALIPTDYRLKQAEYFKKAYGLNDFLLFGEGDFGSPDNPLRKVESSAQEWLAFECPLPVFKRSGPQGEINHQEIFEVRATLNVFFELLSLFEGDTGWPNSQLIVIMAMGVHRGVHGGGIALYFTSAMAKWLSGVSSDCRLLPIEEAMKSASCVMCPRKEPGNRFLAEYRRPKWINFTVPGNACGLDPENYYDESPDRGYQLHTHNADGSYQQFLFLAGLAKLHDLARAG